MLPYPLRTVVFVDGQNLYHGAKDAWAPIPREPGSRYGWPSYDVEKLAAAMCSRMSGRTLVAVRFYTGVPTPEQSALWHGFWSNKLRFLRNRGIYVYRGRVNPGGQEKGGDVSIAVDLIKLTYDQAYDVATIVSQDWDLGPAVRLAKMIAASQGRQVSLESAFCYEPTRRMSPRGIPGTTWVHIDKTMYDACYDPRDYRPPLPAPPG